MATFSKNGKPLGRVSVNGNKNKVWSPEEDNYLALSLKEGVASADDVAARLGRTKASLYFRKAVLQLEGGFTRSKTIKRSTPSFRTFDTAPQEQMVSVPELEQSPRIMVLEMGIPIPLRSNRNEEERIKLRDLFNAMQVGMSFVVPRNLVHVAKHLANKEFEAMRIKASATSKDKRFFRIFRVA